MNAESREAVFESLRKQGIRAIKVVAADGSKANGEIRGVRKRVLALSVAVAAAVAAGLSLWIGGLAKEPPVDDVRPSVKMVPASSLARQSVMGSRARIENQLDCVFKSKADRFLAKFAEPGRPFEIRDGELPTDEEFAAALDEVIEYAEDEFTECIDLKRIVVGLKREMSAYLRGGGTAKGYVDELVERQRLEIALREKAERRVAELAKGKEKDAAQTAYQYWLKANAQLQGMGIYPIPLSGALRNFQLSSDIEE